MTLCSPASISCVSPPLQPFMHTSCVPTQATDNFLMMCLSHSFSRNFHASFAAVYVYSYDMGLNIKNSFPVFSTHLEANYISKREDLYSIYALTDEDRQDILTLAKDPRIGGFKVHFRQKVRRKFFKIFPKFIGK